MSEFVWKTQEVAAEQSAHPENVRRVLVLYTGGTIGMKWSKESGRPLCFQHASDGSIIDIRHGLYLWLNHGGL